jgi:hypothetical protein
MSPPLPAASAGFFFGWMLFWFRIAPHIACRSSVRSSIAGRLDAGGSIQLAYPRGPAGIRTFMVKLGPDGRLQSNVDLLGEAGLARIHPGMTRAQVLRVLGPPDYGRTAYFKARDDLVWDWRACTYNLNIQRIYVQFDATAGTVRSTMSQDELFGREGITLHCVR